MRQIIIVGIIIGLVLLCVLPQLYPPVQYVAGRLYVRSRGICAELYTKEIDPIDGMSVLWNGGRVTTKADLSGVELGDMVDIYTVEGEHLVLECVGFLPWYGWLMDADGGILIRDGWRVYRCIRL